MLAELIIQYMKGLCDLSKFGVVSFSLIPSWFRLQVYKLGTKALALSLPFSIIIGFLAAVTTIALGEVSSFFLEIFVLFGWGVAMFVLFMKRTRSYIYCCPSLTDNFSFQSLACL